MQNLSLGESQNIALTHPGWTCKFPLGNNKREVNQPEPQGPETPSNMFRAKWTLPKLQFLQHLHHFNEGIPHSSLKMWGHGCFVSVHLWTWALRVLHRAGFGVGAPSMGFGAISTSISVFLSVSTRPQLSVPTWSLQLDREVPSQHLPWLYQRNSIHHREILGVTQRWSFQKLFRKLCCGAPPPFSQCQQPICSIHLSKSLLRPLCQEKMPRTALGENKSFWLWLSHHHQL